MGRLTYALPEDVVRLTFGATTARAGTSAIATAIDNDDILGTEDDRAYLTTLLDRAESRWDREATPMKPTPVGSDAVPEFYDAKGKPWPIRLYLDHANVHPIDSADGDFVQIRTGRDEYEDITGQEGSAWTADYDRGIVTVYRAPGAGQLPAFHRVRDKFLKISYRLSAGGDFSRAGQTTLGEDVTDTQTGTVDVANAERLPESGETVLLGGAEYAYVSSADHANDTVELAERGVDLTPATSHSSGDEIHFAPSEVREAVALMAAVRVATGEDFTEGAFDTDLDWGSKIERWNSEIDDTIANYTNQAGYA